MLKSDLIEDLSALTTIQKTSLDRLVSQSYKCLCYDLVEAKKSGKDTFAVNIGIGTLTIHFDNDAVKYRFSPSTKLEEYLVDAIVNDTHPIIEDIDESLVDKITNTYKELFK